MNNPLKNLLTKDEQKILGFLAVILIAGFGLSHTGISSMYAEKPDKEKIALEQATAVDSVIRIDIRIADRDELMLLPGIGEKRADIIIEYRSAKQFESDEELLNIKGIGAKTFLKMQPMLLSFGEPGQGVLNSDKLRELKEAESLSETGSSLSDKQELDATGSFIKKENAKQKVSSDQEQFVVHLNTASLQELVSLNGIGEVKAQAIIDYRKEIGHFTSVDQLLEVKGIGPKTLEKNRNRLSL